MVSRELTFPGLRLAHRPAHEGPPWRILVVDDEPEVHAVTELALRRVVFRDRPLALLSAHSADEARRMLCVEPDIALVLLDVVMETEHAGLELVRFIREELGNTSIRVVLRTGQPGQAPERDVILRYDIDDYKAKTELTADKLFTCTIAGLRAYAHIVGLQESRRQLENLITLEVVAQSLRIENERLAAAKTEAEAASRAKSDLVAVISHELRSPLNGILGAAQLLLAGRLDAEQHEHAELLLRSGQSMLHIVNDLLDTAKMEAGRLELETIDVDPVEVVEEALSLMAARAQEKGLALAGWVAPEVPAVLVGDPIRLRQILLNLLGNAIKFTQAGSVTVTVQAEPVEADGVVLSFAVADTGMGIDAETQDRLFRPFGQADRATARRFGGTGLGLSICKSLCELMSGRIWVDSAVGQGSTFCVTVRLAVRVGPDARRRPQPGGRVLVVDPPGRPRELLRRCLAGWHIESEACADEESALALLEGRTTRYRTVLVGRRAAVSLDRLTAAARGAAVLSVGGPAARLAEPLREAALAAALDGVAVEPVSHAAPHDNARGAPALSILLVEDNVLNQMIATKMLAAAGHSVVTASNGLEALAMAGERRFDLILMDRVMPVMDGLEATRLIRALGGRPAEVPIIALTGAAAPSEIEEFRRAGIDEFVTKPIDFAALRATMARCLAER